MAEWVDYIDRQGTTIGSEAVIGEFSLIVHRYMSYDSWYLSCGSLFENAPLNRKKLAEAKYQAVAELQIVLQEALDELLEGYK